MMHSNNEIGAVLPVAGIAAACKPRGAVVHTDAAQSVGKVPVKVSGRDPTQRTRLKQQRRRSRGEGDRATQSDGDASTQPKS